MRRNEAAGYEATRQRMVAAANLLCMSKESKARSSMAERTKAKEDSESQSTRASVSNSVILNAHTFCVRTQQVGNRFPRSIINGISLPLHQVFKALAATSTDSAAIYNALHKKNIIAEHRWRARIFASSKRIAAVVWL